MDHFHYKNGELYCEEISCEKLASQFGTPLYIYSASIIRENCQQFLKAFSSHPTEICYAVKANYNLSILNEVFSLGLGADVVSVGELERALKAGLAPDKVVFSGVGKTQQEIERAITVGVGAINVESQSELLLIKKTTEATKKKISINLRVNPNIDVKTNPYIATGLYQTKFGIVDEMVVDVIETIKNHPYVIVEGLACHIGSQILELASFEQAARRLKKLATELQMQGYPISRLDMGGGLGIAYQEKDKPPSISRYGETLLKVLGESSLKLYLEPGRAIIGNAGGLLTRVIHTKENKKRHFTIVDAAMNDLIRPCLYEAFHQILSVRESKEDKVITDVVGPVCETGDFLGLGREISAPKSGDLLFVKTTGAYGASMASNYNARPRAAEILVSGDKTKIIRRRETLESLWELELSD
jgi:diaminopimelate decarboxylase